jgi:hypothetical protein
MFSRKTIANDRTSTDLTSCLLNPPTLIRKCRFIKRAPFSPVGTIWWISLQNTLDS